MMSVTVSSLLSHCAKGTALPHLLSLCHVQRGMASQCCCLGLRPSKAWLRGPSSHRDCALGPGVGPRAPRHSSSAGEDPDYQLTPAQVDGILQANEQSVRVPELEGRGQSAVLRFESNQLAANTPNEDRRSSATCLQTRGMMFGVFDGHCGHACAQTVSERLLYYAAVALMPQRSLEEIEDAVESRRPVPPLLQWYKHHNDYNYRESSPLYAEHLRLFWQELLAGEEHLEGMSPQDALDRAFRRLDADISLEAQAPLESDPLRSAALQTAFAGSTACVAFVDGEGVHVANAGDCRAVLGAQAGDGSWSAVPLSRDHNATNGVEVERVRSRHPEAEQDTVVADERLLGILMPLRAFGDVRFKWSRELQRSVLEDARDLEDLAVYQYTPPNYLTPPYLEAAPELTYHRLRPGDRFLILASDGLWDMLESQEAVQLVAEHLTGLRQQGALFAREWQVGAGRARGQPLECPAPAAPHLDANSATHLIRHAIGLNEYGEVDQERLAAMLSLPEDTARMYRDDITVTVIYFNSNTMKEQEN
ncbi:pyruvate dehydrogenase [acetyl-transferring]-phosphatase 2, mitochondrial-like [Megalops cyprinoides]|uniref:pyruvate dehydrogenase [acetyl-transferring]-phosphatase 2, mitochondrial-like n=1 Tax=Megalops cyprinoides TaxID=118141 RepID=UPI0018648196|nr:pyruvate dehydrogenase [acetyl-transferring]-phosphatase 2, mitochondrial-like [Megalops cyprinoides]